MQNGCDSRAVGMLFALAVACPSPNNSTTIPGGGSTNADIQPLSEDTLVFWRFKDENGLDVIHLYAYDTASKKETLLSNLDDDGKSGTDHVGHLSISPDRRWIAFAAFFRPTQADLNIGLATQSIWVVSADGKVFKRLTLPMDDGAKSCTTDNECVSGGYCQGLAGHSHCRPRNFNMEVDTPTWTPDGQTVYFNFTETWWTSGGMLAGGAFPHSVPATGGADTFYQLTNDSGLCQTYSDPSVSPDGKSMIVNHAECGGDGVYIHDVPPSGSGTLLVSIPSNSRSFDQPAEWLPDSSAALVLLTTTDGTVDDAGAPVDIGAVVATSDAKKVVFDTVGLGSFALAPDGKRIALCVADSSGMRLLLADRTAPHVSPTPLLENGCHPAW